MECSPLHRGHVYLLEEARRRTGADYLLVVLGGDFMQRGIPAVIDRHARTRALLASGADLVLELPVYYSCAAAGYFAMGGVSLLDSIGVVTELAFGSESGEPEALLHTAGLLLQETPSFQGELRSGLSAGLSWPAARSRAYLNSTGSALPSGPNDVLGIEYLKALHALDSPIRPCVIQRIPSASATQLRRQLEDSTSLPDSPDGDAPLPPEIPAAMRAELAASRGISSPVFPDDLSAELGWTLHSLAADETRSCHEQSRLLRRYVDVSPALADRILALRGQYRSFTDFCERLKTRDLTYTRISRALLHILLGMRQEMLEDCLAGGVTGYARVLGFRREAAPLLGAIQGSARVLLITKPAAQIQSLSPAFQTLMHEEMRIARLYRCVCARKYSGRYPYPIRSEFSVPLDIPSCGSSPSR